MTHRVRPVSPAERDRWLDFRASLWPASPRDELAREQAECVAQPDRFAVLFAVDSHDRPIGFAEVSRRESAEGCAPCPPGVGYIEAWYVEPAHRHRGVGAALLAAAEDWAASHSRRDMASDAELDNQASINAHRACGYQEVDRVVLLRKPIRR